MMGAHLRTIDGVQGTLFAVWAPNALAVSLVGDFNGWDGRINPMRAIESSGIWELFGPSLTEGEKYKFEIQTQAGELRVKSDPHAFYSELRPHTASIVFDLERHKWQDHLWMEARKKAAARATDHVYEVHLGSWKHFGSGVSKLSTSGELLGDLLQRDGFTHVELLPIMEHPFG